MKQSHLFPKTQRHAPKDEVSRNAQLLERAGYTSKLMAGVYTYLPLGWRVLKKIEGIIRDEMNKIDGQELFMPALHPHENYVKTGREEIDVLFHLESASGKKLVLGQSHEEVIVPLVQKYLKSYKELPLYLYQIQSKFRNELRAKSGILRGREFIMKDLYSFHTDQKDLDEYYLRVKQAYHNIFDRVGLGQQTYYTFASGGTFSEFSHEFQTTTEAGEDVIHLCETCRVAVNDELKKPDTTCPECGKKDLVEKKAIEVGNIFPLKSKFSDKFGLTYTDESGNAQPVLMGCYGIGLGRVMGAVTEVNNDDKGIVWPQSVTPYHVHLISLSKDPSSIAAAESVYTSLQRDGFDVLYDERDESAGVKLKDSDLIGIPIRLVISDKTKDKIEYGQRATTEQTLLTPKEVQATIKKYYS